MDKTNNNQAIIEELKKKIKEKYEEQDALITKYNEMYSALVRACRDDSKACDIEKAAIHFARIRKKCRKMERKIWILEAKTRLLEN